MQYIIGNWKMNGNLQANQALLSTLVNSVNTKALPPQTAIALCVPFPYLAQCQAILQNTDVILGAQNLSEYSVGAYTGEISASMLKDVGATFVIVGHSERRALFGEDDATVARKLKAAITGGLRPIFCMGETLEAREADKVNAVIGAQLSAMIDTIGVDDFINAGGIIAYEPVWAIGTGKTASPNEAQTVHAFIHHSLIKAGCKTPPPILYGGSMKPDNAAELLAQTHIHGGLIGGASLHAESFLRIAYA